MPTPSDHQPDDPHITGRPTGTARVITTSGSGRPARAISSQRRSKAADSGRGRASARPGAAPRGQTRSGPGRRGSTLPLSVWLLPGSEPGQVHRQALAQIVAAFGPTHLADATGPSSPGDPLPTRAPSGHPGPGPDPAPDPRSGRAASTPDSTGRGDPTQGPVEGELAPEHRPSLVAPDRGAVPETWPTGLIVLCRPGGANVAGGHRPACQGGHRSGPGVGRGGAPVGGHSAREPVADAAPGFAVYASGPLPDGAAALRWALVIAEPGRADLDDAQWLGDRVAPGGILAVLTHSHHGEGGFRDPRESVVPAVAATGLAYLQHIVIAAPGLAGASATAWMADVCVFQRPTEPTPPHLISEPPADPDPDTHTGPSPDPEVQP